MSKERNLFLTALALAGGAWIGYADSRSDDVFITLGLLFGFGLLLGALGPRRASLWPPLVALWVPALDAILPRFGLAPQRPGESFTFPSALAVAALVLAICFAGSYLGAALNWVVGRAWTGASDAPKS